MVGLYLLIYIGPFNEKSLFGCYIIYRYKFRSLEMLKPIKNYIMKTENFIKVKKCSLQFAIEKANDNIHTTLLEVEELPNDFVNENLYGESRYRSMDGDCCTRFPEKGIAVLKHRSMADNRAEGSIVRSETIFYKKGFVTEVEVLERVDFTEEYSIIFDYKRENGYLYSIPEGLFESLKRDLNDSEIEVSVNRDSFHGMIYTIKGKSAINRWLKCQSKYVDYIKSTYLR